MQTINEGLRPKTPDADMKRPQVAVIGIGIMGNVLSRRLLELGYPVAVYNRTRSKAEALASAGAQVAATPQQAAAMAEIILTVVSDPSALSAVLFGIDGIVARKGNQRLLIDLGTNEPSAIVELSAKAVTSGFRFLEAPMAGSVHDAQHGSLTFLVGGEEASFESARPFLETLGKTAIRFGPIGCGNTAKLALNLLVGIMAKGLAEAIALLNANGLPVDIFLGALDNSGLASPLFRRIGERYLQRDFSPRFSVSNLDKDIQFLLSTAKAKGLDLPLAAKLASSLADLNPMFRRLDYSVLLACESVRFGVEKCGD